MPAFFLEFSKAPFPLFIFIKFYNLFCDNDRSKAMTVIKEE